jgi:hypothetical protein
MTETMPTQPNSHNGQSIARIWVPMVVLLIVLGSLLFLIEAGVVEISIRIMAGGAV